MWIFGGLVGVGMAGWTGAPALPSLRGRRGASGTVRKGQGVVKIADGVHLLEDSVTRTPLMRDLRSDSRPPREPHLPGIQIEIISFYLPIVFPVDDYIA